MYYTRFMCLITYLTWLGLGVAQAGLFDNNTTDMIDDLEQLRKAIGFSLPITSKDYIRDEILSELNVYLRRDLGDSGFAAVKVRPESLSQAQGRKFLELVNSGKYFAAIPNAASIYDGEIWRRRNEKSHRIIMEAKFVRDYSHSVIDFNLSQDELPFGGYFFPDNFGGITARWNNHSLRDEFFDYRTFYENVFAGIRDEQLPIFNSLSAQDFSKVERFCSGLNARRAALPVVENEDGEDINAEKRLALGTFDCFIEMNRATLDKRAYALVVERLRGLSQFEFDALSPTEKYDIWNGFYDFRTTIFEKYYKGKRRFDRIRNAPYLSTLGLASYWEGRCNADRASGIVHRHAEPAFPVRVNIPEVGKVLTFEPLDVKALLMSTYFELEDENYAQMGMRTERSLSRELNPNPAALDILLRSLFMRYKVPFVIDKKNAAKVVNVSVIGFRREVKKVYGLRHRERNSVMSDIDDVLGRTENPLRNFNPAAGADSWQNPRMMCEKGKQATKGVDIELKLKILGEIKKKAEANGPTKGIIAAELAGARHDKYTDTKKYSYTLYITDNGEIVEGGHFKGDMDFLWFAAGRGNQENSLEGNKDIKYDVVARLARKSATGGGMMTR
ncbi:MAG: hypothetical protein HQK53_17095 [Oligoflexia bacterium]|nr:hypothetical protein [Oligoflexia bacterium]